MFLQSRVRVCTCGGFWAAFPAIPNPMTPVILPREFLHNDQSYAKHLGCVENSSTRRANRLPRVLNSRTRRRSLVWSLQLCFLFLPFTFLLVQMILGLVLYGVHISLPTSFGERQVASSQGDWRAGFLTRSSAEKSLRTFLLLPYSWLLLFFFLSFSICSLS